MTQDRLQQYRTIRREQAQIHRLQDALRDAKSIVRCKMYPNLYMLHTDLIDLYSAKLTDLYTEQLAIERAIESLPGNLRTLMRYRVIEGMEWEEICTILKYSWTHVHRIRRKTLKLLDDIEEGRG